MQSDIAGWLATQVDLRGTAPNTTTVPRDDELNAAPDLLQQMAGQSLLASVQLEPGAVIGEGGSDGPWHAKTA